MDYVNYTYKETTSVGDSNSETLPMLPPSVPAAAVVPAGNAADGTLTDADLERFCADLKLRERSAATIEKYLHDVREFQTFLGGSALTQEAAIAWKQELMESELLPGTINVRIAAANALFRFLQLDIHLASVRQQRRMFRSEAQDLSREEYRRLVNASQEAGDAQLMLLLRRSVPPASASGK